MSDNEWESWQKTFQAKKDPLPEISKRASRTRRGMWAANVIFFGIVIVELLAAIPMLRDTGHDADISHVTGLGLILVMLGMSVGFVKLQRGLWSPVTSNAREQLEYMERWTRGSERAAMLARQGGVVCGGFTAVVCTAAWMNQRPPLAVMVVGALFIAAVVIGCWYSPVLNERRLKRYRARLDQWRAELDG
ncbi:MAG: hypothetical protein JST54_04740 [Deltaproteobacteria bacterium]|nr:hypothetical protein [Deltaproteobacteria bacterium]